MKALTANRLSDGAVLYLGHDDALVERFEHAVLFDDAEAKAKLSKLVERATVIAAAYVIEADETGPAGREALRETIRSKGPTVRRDLGKQAEAPDERL